MESGALSVRRMAPNRFRTLDWTCCVLTIQRIIPLRILVPPATKCRRANPDILPLRRSRSFLARFLVFVLPTAIHEAP
jgi:hypothetical protein